MAKRPTIVDENPAEFPQTTPRDLHDTSDIRFVMRDMGTLTERIDGLIKSVEKIGPASEKALDKHSTDVKERLAELKAEIKEGANNQRDMKSSIDTFKGAMIIMSGIYAAALALTAALLAWYLKAPSQPPAPPAATLAPAKAVDLNSN